MELRPIFDAAPARQVYQWADNVGGNWNDPARWSGGVVPPDGASPYVYLQEGGVSTFLDLNATWDSVRADGVEAPVVVHQAGNFNLRANEFAIGTRGPAPGTGAIYRMAAGTLTAQTGYAGASGVGTIAQVGGEAVFSQFLSIAENETNLGATAPIKAAYTFGGGTLLAGQINVGYRGVGTLQISGGSVLVSGFYSVGHLNTGVGTVEMISGTLTAAQAYVSLGGAGTFLQYGGAHTLIDWLDIAEGAGAGSYYMLGGTLSAGELAVGLGGGAAVYHQEAGQISVGYFYVGPGGTAEILGGELAAATIEFDGPVNLNRAGFNTLNDCRAALAAECAQGDIFTPYGAVGYSDAIVEATVAGDVNLDRAVNISDYSIIGANYNVSGFWDTGDVNYDGTVGIADFAVVASNWNQTFSSRVPVVAWPLMVGLLFRRRAG